MERLVAVDVGGTFTDCVAFDGSRISVAKVPTTADQSAGVLAGASALAATRPFDRLLHGSTVATNALLERKGARTVLVTDEGFEDVIEIGRQDRPSLYDSFADRPEPLVGRGNRVGAGNRLSGLRRQVADLDPEAVAVSLAYSFADSTAEERVAEELAGVVSDLSLSHLVVAEFREFERTSTTVLNAYLSPVAARYLRRLGAESSAVAESVEVMRSSGGLMELAQAAALPAALLLSGPAGGVVAAASMARSRGYGRAVTFDMGGTSTDVCLIEDGRAEVGYERPVAGYPCRMPSVSVHTVGAGGGSIAWVDPGGSLRVGPQSSGSEPGPACYGRGGTEATVTDANLFLGRLGPGAGLAGGVPLDRTAAIAALARHGRLGLDVGEVAAGVIEVVEAHMLRAIRAVSVGVGSDPRQATLVAYGGAGGLHATALARELEMERVAIPPHAGVFSALGLLMAPPRHDAARTVILDQGSADAWAAALASIAWEARNGYEHAHGRRPAEVELVADMRYVGQAHEVTVPVRIQATRAEATARFHELHQQANGFSRRHDPVEVVTVRAAAVGRPLVTWTDLPPLVTGPLPEPARHSMWVGGEPTTADVWWRPDLPAGSVIRGPAVVAEDTGTSLLLPGDTAQVVADGTIEVTW